MLYVIFLLLKQIVDQPERRDAKYIMAGMRISFKIWVFGTPKKCAQHLSPCESGFQQMRENSSLLKSHILCKNCVTWNMMIKVH